jgi:hypothetical protein
VLHGRATIRGTKAALVWTSLCSRCFLKLSTEASHIATVSFASSRLDLASVKTFDEGGDVRVGHMVSL